VAAGRQCDRSATTAIVAVVGQERGRQGSGSESECVAVTAGRKVDQGHELAGVEVKQLEVLCAFVRVCDQRRKNKKASVRKRGQYQVS